jgi:membrane-associated protein
MYQLLHFLANIDAVIINMIVTYDVWSYLILFIVILCETGLIIMPFLPGDSLLFTVGSLAAYPHSPLNILFLFILLVSASIVGNQINYLMGRFIGPRVFTMKKSWLFKQAHLTKAYKFYERQGGRTIILARFIPIIRTFVPFVAGVSEMRLLLFSFYNSISALLWIGSLLGFGYFFGRLPFISHHFSIIIYGVILLSILPPIVACLVNKQWVYRNKIDNLDLDNTK